MKDLFLDQIQDLYDAEERLIKALPKMAEASSSPELRIAFEEHLAQTRGQLKRLDEVFSILKMEPEGQTCEAMKGLIDEGEHLMEDIKKSPLRDAGLIAAGNRVEHYEMAGYGTARTMARTLGLDRAAELLEQTLEEEKQADARLTAIAEREVNPEAVRAGVRHAR
jgi:ferritin-like metal-binding protein YciE